MWSINLIFNILLVTKFIRIGIADKNDNPPYFEKPFYEAEVYENEDIQHTLLTVTAKNHDESSSIRYIITGGNIDGAFAVNNKTGAIYVAKALDYETINRYELKVSASSNTRENSTTVVINVKDVNDNPPVFEKTTYRTQITEEDDRNLPKLVLKVNATDADKDRPQNIVYFLTGQGVDSDNADNSKFRINRTTGEIFVLKPLDRDQPNGRPQWRFTVFAQDEGGEGLVGYADVQVNLKDVNDNAPVFHEGVYFGNVTENGTVQMTVMNMTAIDYDDPSEGSNAKIIYSIEKNVIEEETGLPIFEIDPETGIIKTAVCCLDRERTPDYSIQVVAMDGGGLKGTGTASIRLKDINDMPPAFTKDEWFTEVDETNGTSLLQTPILTVTVHDEDETNNFKYKVVENSGYGADKFVMIRNSDSTGSLVITEPLDFEDPHQSHGFRFRIQVNDKGDDNNNDLDHVAYSWVVVKLRDINDNVPKFRQSSIEVSVPEDMQVGKSLASFLATDPDRAGKSKVSYTIDRNFDRMRQFSINEEGIVSIQRKLDRELRPKHQTRILAIDDGVPPKTATATLIVTVKDINDNAPRFLKDYRPVITENEGPGKVAEIFAIDDDDRSLGNGPPYQFKLDPRANDSIHSSFRVTQIANGNGMAVVTSLRPFDREQQKEFHIPIIIKDNGIPSMAGTSTLTVVVGDINDNKMQPGSKNILIYNILGQAPETNIGRVYVHDLDDWDLPDKTFYWEHINSEHSKFRLDEDTGMISVRQGTRAGIYHLRFKVYDRKYLQTVSATVTVRIKEIAQEAIINSASLRIAGITDEEFIKIWEYKLQNIAQSKADQLARKIAELLNINQENVDIFSVQLRSRYPPVIDVRLSTHENLHYHKPVRLNGVILMNRKEIEEAIGINITMVGIDECLYENQVCEGSCTNTLNINSSPYMINANKTALVSVNVDVIAECTCRARNFSKDEDCENTPCFNGGTCLEDKNSVKCFCRDGYTGPRCQLTTRSFDGKGWAWYPALDMCEKSHLHFEFVTRKKDGLLIYNGPIVPPKKDEVLVSDYIAVELKLGYPRLLIDFGSGTLELIVKTKKTLDDGEWHRLDLFWDMENVRMVVDFCKSADVVESEDSASPEFNKTSCMAQGTMPPFNEYLNLNTPLQVGGLFIEQFNSGDYHWQFMPVGNNFQGCIRNLFHNSKLYDLADLVFPELSKHSSEGCPQTDEVCHKFEKTERCWEHGSCVSSMNEAKCQCTPGWTGLSCSLPTIPTTFLPQSYVKYALSFEPDRFTTEIQLRFRTRESNGELFRISDQHSREYAILEITMTRLCFRYNLNSVRTEEKNICLSVVSANDGQWHVAKVSRYGSAAILEMNGGEGRRYNETAFEFSGHQWLMVDKQEGVYAGGKAEFTGVRTFEVYADFHKGCLDDIRLEGKQLPLPPNMNGTQWGQATMARNLNRGCASNKPCSNIVCPEPFECVDLWNDFLCTCSEGRIISADSKDCIDKNECADLPCLNGGTCFNLEPAQRYRCSCPYGFLGENCELVQKEQTLKLSLGALAVILVCLLLLLVLVLVFVICNRQRKAHKKYPGPNDDVRENIINYDDEGGGEDDMTAFDIAPLQIPINTEIESNDSAPTEILEREDCVGTFIDQYAKHDLNVPPFDDLRNYAFEGCGSTSGSLSSLASGTDDEQQDYDYLDTWGPRFTKLASMYAVPVHNNKLIE